MCFSVCEEIVCVKDAVCGCLCLCIFEMVCAGYFWERGTGFYSGQFLNLWMCLCARVCFSVDVFSDSKSGEFRGEDSVSLLAFQPGFSPEAHCWPTISSKPDPFNSNRNFFPNLPWDIFFSYLYIYIYLYSRRCCLHLLLLFFGLCLCAELSAHSCIFQTPPVNQAECAHHCYLFFLTFSFDEVCFISVAGCLSCLPVQQRWLSLSVMLTIHFVLFMPNKPQTSNTSLFLTPQKPPCEFKFGAHTHKCFYEKEIQLLPCFCNI